MAKSKKKATQKIKKEVVNSRSRKLQLPQYKSFKLNKRVKYPKNNLPGSFRILINSFKHIWQHKRIFALISLVYVVLTLMFVKSFSLGSSLSNTTNSKNLSGGLSVFGNLISNSNSASNDVTSLYQTILMVIISLVVIWVLRQTYAKQKVSLKEAFYKSQYPLIQFLGVCVVLILQLLPLIIASAFYSYIFGNGLAVTAVEQVIWLVLFFLLSLLSLYMISSSIFAIYIVTLPDVSPFNALRSARNLVRFRRWTVLRKVIFLPIALLIILALIGLPLILYLTPIAAATFFVMTMLGLLVAHTYLYGLYRELL